jgi:hypothetical protein
MVPIDDVGFLSVRQPTGCAWERHAGKAGRGTGGVLVGRTEQYVPEASNI